MPVETVLDPTSPLRLLVGEFAEIFGGPREKMLPEGPERDENFADRDHPVMTGQSAAGLFGWRLKKRTLACLVRLGKEEQHKFLMAALGEGWWLWRDAPYYYPVEMQKFVAHPGDFGYSLEGVRDSNVGALFDSLLIPLVVRAACEEHPEFFELAADREDYRDELEEQDLTKGDDDSPPGAEAGV